MLPLASSPTDLSRGADVTSVVASMKVFRYPAADQSYLVMVNAVYASSTFTSIVWTIHAVEAGGPADGLDAAARRCPATASAI
jgi:hypothetical protein